MKYNTPLKPQARLENLVVQELSDELLIYNLETNRAFNLNQTSALVWQNCDGNKDINQITKEIEKKLNQNVPNELVWLAIDSLKKEGLVNFSEFPKFDGITRREMVRRVGLTSIAALPVISSLIAPNAINAASGDPPAPVCFACSKKTIEQCATCNNALGTCYNNSGCGNGGVLQIGITCEDCLNNF